MNKKKLLLPAFLFASLLTFTACSKESRNVNVPYANLDLTASIAKSTDKDINLSLDTYYSKLRYSGYNLVTEKIKSAFYSKNFTAFKDLLFKNYNELTNDELIALSYDGKAISQARFDELKSKYIKSISDDLATAIISTTTYEGYSELKPTEADSDYAKAVYKYIQNKNKTGYELDNSYISFAKDNEEDNHILLDLNKFYEKGSKIVDTYILDYAEDFYVGSEVYKIADQEYIYATDDETGSKTKNSLYLFNEDKYESTFNTYYKTYGTYNAVVITFASRKEAMQTIEAVFGSANYDISSLDDYLALYNYYYSSQKEDGNEFKITDDVFNYTVSSTDAGFDNLVSGVKELITDILKDGEFLTEPRNLSGNYVLVYRNSAVYEASGNSTQLKYDDLDEATKKAYVEKIQTKLIEENISTYATTVFKKLIKNSDLKIYDPIFETKFYNSYTDQYNLINKDDFNNELILKLGDTEYKVTDFYNEASLEYGLNIITEYFEQGYALKYVSDYVSEDTQKSNSESLKTVVDAFKKGNNSTYSKSIGLENFLVANYGFKTEDEVLNYYFNAKSALSTYLAKTIYEEWATLDQTKSTDDTKYYTLSSECETLMNTLLSAGNSNYEDIFNINLDHILIFVDFDNDGNPDDPTKYLEKHPDLVTDFNNALNALVKAIYQEALCADYKGNSLYSILSYISAQFVKGSELRAGDLNGDGNTDTWDDYKSLFHFQLKAEKLASDSDITQTSVSNFVKPFAEYVKDLYKKAVEDDVTVDKEYGVFFTPTDGKLTQATDVDKVSVDTICETQYGYHLLVLNSYSGPDSLVFSASKDDPNGYQAEIKLLIDEDEDNSDNNIYITINSYNEDSATAATLNQLFIYYIETKNGASTSLDSKIYATLQTLFSDVISTFTSSNFQNLVLLDEIKITSDDTKISSILATNRQSLVDLVCNYGENDDLYLTWCDVNNHSIFKRPNQK